MKGPQAGEDFSKFSKRVVEDFLQTVVVLDDQAYMEPEEIVAEVVEPDDDVVIVAEEDAGQQPSGDAAKDVPNTLDAQQLITTFAGKGLVCGVLSPVQGQDVSETTLKASRRADIVILDWQLGDEGAIATSIIKRLREEDESVGGRLRLIAVYTASLDLKAIREAISKEVAGLQEIDLAGGLVGLEGNHIRIVVAKKGATSENTGSLVEADLAERLISEFLELGKGILPNVAFGSIAAIREHTHRVLARFDRKMDGPYLSHRILLKTPDDAEGYAVDLLASEFLAIMRGRDIGGTHAGGRAIKLALDHYQAGGHKFNLMTIKDSDQKLLEVSVEDLMRLVEGGADKLSEINGAGSESALHQRVYLVLDTNLGEGKRTHYAFSRASAFTREAVTSKADFQAKLDLGSIVRIDGVYYMCVQPLCDAVRLNGNTQFIFAPLVRVEADKKFELVVKTPQGDTILLKLPGQASSMRTATFAPSADRKVVLSAPENSAFVFNSTTGEKFEWICDLRTSFAQRFVHKIASNLSRIGLDEFEWQRRQAT